MDAQIINALDRKFISLASDLDERGRRRWAACEAIAIGCGGISAVSIATGLSDHTNLIAILGAYDRRIFPQADPSRTCCVPILFGAKSALEN